MKPNHVLFVAYGGGHVAMLAPLATELMSKGQPFTFLALTTARSALERQGIPCIGFRDLPGADDADTQRWGRQLAAELPAGGAVAPDETIAYLGLSFRDLVQEVGTTEAHERYAKHGRQAFLPVAAMRRAISHIAPALVVTTNSPRAERAAIVAAGQLGLPSVCAVDLFALQEVQWIGKPGYATRLCVLNESVRRMFMEHGRRADEVVVTGNPAFEPLTQPAARSAATELQRERGWDDGRRTILWASQPEPERHPFADRAGDPTLPRRVESALRDLVATKSGLRLVVRYHPSERVNFVPGPNVDFSPASDPIATLLNAVDAVVVTASTVGLEAAIAGRPVVSVDTSIFTPDTLYNTMGVSRGVTSIEDLGACVMEALEGPGQTFSQPQSGKTATHEILQIMDSLLN